MSTDINNPEPHPTANHPLVVRVQKIMAHAWMVRTFIKHATETEDFPELMGIVRTVFDISRALETRIDNHTAYFKMLGKKIGKLKAAVGQFALDAPVASTHTNFAQAVISIQTVTEDLARLLEEYRQANHALDALNVNVEVDESQSEDEEDIEH